MNVKLHIEKLVLDGIDLAPEQRRQLQAALEAELGSLLTAGGIGADLAAGAMVPSVGAKSLEMSGDGNPAQLGRQIANSVYGGIGK